MNAIEKRVLLATLVALVLVPACAPYPAPPPERKNPGGNPAAGTPDDDSRDIDVTRPPFQAKSSAQLARSIEACVGKGAITVSASMVITPENESGFLTSDFAEGDDIVEVQNLLVESPCCGPCPWSHPAGRAGSRTRSPKPDTRSQR